MKPTQPRKQHRALYNAPSHMRYRLFSAPLSDALKASHKVGSAPVRSGDTVRVMRGDKKGVEGKVTSIDRSKYRLFIEGVTREKVDGSAVQVPLHPSKVMITGLNLDDKWRRASFKVEASKEAEKPTEEPRKERRKPRTRKAPSEKAKAPRKRKTKTSKTEEQGEAESG